jgi:hypothetical protein
VEEDGIDDNHGETSTEDSGTVYDEMKSRPEDERLTRHHANPGDEFHGDRELGCIYVIDDEKVSQSKRDDAKGSDEQAPEVAPAIALEGSEAEDDQLEGIIPGYGDEASQSGILRKLIDRTLGEAGATARDTEARHKGILCGGGQGQRWSCEGFYKAHIRKTLARKRMAENK